MSGKEHSDEQTWKEARFEIIEFLKYVLLRIEMHYGSNRAPIMYPPEFRQNLMPDGTAEYTCIIRPDFEDEPPLIYTDTDPAALLPVIRNDIIERYNPPGFDEVE